jgi:nucleotide-binding universal stress UspA family protein
MAPSPVSRSGRPESDGAVRQRRRGLERKPESARALAESIPYLHEAKKVGVVVVEGPHPAEADALKGNDAVQHLRHHGINAVKYRAVGEEDEIADVLISECRKLDADLLVMGSYGHSSMRELLPGSTTSHVVRRSPFRHIRASMGEAQNQTPRPSNAPIFRMAGRRYRAPAATTTVEALT